MANTAEYDLAGKVIGFAMKVHRVLGPGFLEAIYQRALQVELQRAGFGVELEVPIHVHYEGVVVGDYKADFLIGGELIVELKAVERFIAAHEVQLVHYLSATGKDTGLLLNFGAERFEFKRKFRTMDLLRRYSADSVHSV